MAVEALACGGHPLYFLETFVDPERFRGTCYRAANGIVLGQTTGRGKDDQTHRPHRSLKEVLGYPAASFSPLAVAAVRNAEEPHVARGRRARSGMDRNDEGKKPPPPKSIEVDQKQLDELLEHAEAGKPFPSKRANSCGRRSGRSAPARLRKGHRS